MKPHQLFSSIHPGIAVPILMVAACTGTEPLDSAHPSLGLSFDQSSVVAGDVLEVDVLVSGMHDVYGVALDLVYDPSKLEFRDASSGDFLGIDGLEAVFAAALEDDTPGRLVAGVSRVGNAPGVGGSGTVLTASFMAYEDIYAEDDVVTLEEAHVLDSHLEEVSLFSEI